MPKHGALGFHHAALEHWRGYASRGGYRPRSNATHTDTVVLGGVADAAAIVIESRDRNVGSIGADGSGYWLKVTSTGGIQTVPITQFTSETSRPFLEASGSGVFSAICASATNAIIQSGGVDTVRFYGGSPGTVWYIHIRFSTAHVIGESTPRPNTSVRYLFRSRGATSEIDLVR